MNETGIMAVATAAAGSACLTFLVAAVRVTLANGNKTEEVVEPDERAN